MSLIVRSWMVFLPIILACSSLIAQPQLDKAVRNKLSPLLQAEIAQHREAYFPEKEMEFREWSSDEMQFLILEANPAEIRDQVEKLGGKIHSVTGSYLTARIPKGMLLHLAKLPAVKRVHFNNLVKLHNDSAAIRVGANKVQNGVEPLPRGYSGKGVVIGVIDTGVDFKHPDFRDPENPSRSRLAFIWDQQSSDGKAPDAFGYGTEWTRSQLEAELSDAPPGLVSHVDTNSLALGHGTHVLGTAGGNTGLAYEADLIMVSTDFNWAKIIDGVNYIISKAEEMQQPCVINLSFSSAFSPHDGSSFESNILDLILDGSKGLVICSAAGNSGSSNEHWGGFQVEADSLVMYAGGAGFLGLYLVVPSEYLSTMELAVAVDSASYNGQIPTLISQKPVGRTPWKRMDRLLDQGYTEKFFHSNGKLAGQINIFGLPNPDKVYSEFFVQIFDGTDAYNYLQNLSKLDLYRFMVRGSGSFNSWFSAFIPIAITDPALAGLPTDRYASPDNQFGVGSPGDARQVITVGAYTNRMEWMDINQETAFFVPRQPPGSLASFSSTGPTLDGRIKPEIVAPGKGIISAVPSYVEFPSFIKVDDGLRAVFQGTSMATPVVAGAAALLLEMDPEMDHSQVRTLLIENADQDEYTAAFGPLPNKQWGYGKLNIFNTMLSASGLTDTREKGISPEPDFRIFPNPAHQEVRIGFSLDKPMPVSVRLLNQWGQEMKSVPNRWMSGGEYVEIMDIREFPAGIYLVRLEIDGAVRTQKLVVY